MTSIDAAGLYRIYINETLINTNGAVSWNLRFVYWTTVENIVYPYIHGSVNAI